MSIPFSNKDKLNFTSTPAAENLHILFGAFLQFQIGVDTAERLYIGFWTDKGTCDDAAAGFLAKLHGKEVFLFGTAGFGGEASYFERILKNVSAKLNGGNTVIGTFMCQGRMPMTVRERYEKMLASPVQVPNLKGMIENFDRALSHPDEADLAQLKMTVPT